MRSIACFSFAVRLCVAAALAGALAGCDTLNDWLAPDKVDYKSARTAPSLDVPPDLTQAKVGDRFTAPASTAGLGTVPPRVRTEAGIATAGVPTAQDPLGMHVERDGDRYWLVVDGRTPEQLWPQLKEFWQENGFVLTTDRPDTGVLATDWTENRAKIGGDWFYNTFGKLVDWAYSSGTRDQFTTLVERGANGVTDVSITHRGMEEVLTGQDKDSSRWADVPRNPALEQVFLTRLMHKLGLTDIQARQLLTDAHPAAPRQVVVDARDGAPTLNLGEPFERAWLRVGLALDRSHFAVDRFDKAKGLYYVRYADPQQEVKREGFLGKLLYGGGAKASAKKEYRVNVRPNGDAATQVAVVDADGRPDASPDAQRIVSALHAQLN